MPNSPEALSVQIAARLAMLDLQPQEIPLLESELEAMTALMAPLAQALAEEAPPEPSSQAPSKGLLREDRLSQSLSVAEVLQNAKRVQGAYIRIPKTYES